MTSAKFTDCLYYNYITPLYTIFFVVIIKSCYEIENKYKEDLLVKGEQRSKNAMPRNIY